MANDNGARQGPTTPTRRLLRMSGMTAAIASRMAGQRVKGVFQSQDKRQRDHDALMREVGEQVATTLGEMKGAVMKVGQIASQMQDILPRQVADALQVLQKSSPPMPYATIRDQIVRELGAEPQTLFADFDATPFAAASIGQVHRACLADGREVIVKVQYPGVQESVDSDMKQLRRVMRLGGLLKVEPQALDAIFADIRDQLREELDYVQEAAHLRAFCDFHDEPWLVIPQVIDDYSTTRVLTMTLETGDDLDSIQDNAAYNQATRNLLGTRLFDIISREIYEFGRLHSDPHPGNFAFRPDGTIVMYDFGAIKRISSDDANEFRAFMRAALARDYAAIEASLKRLGIRKQDDKTIPETYYAGWVNLLWPVVDEQPYDYGNSRLHLYIAKKTTGTPWKYITAFQPSARVLQVDRVLGGHYWTMVKLGVHASFRTQLEAYL